MREAYEAADVQLRDGDARGLALTTTTDASYPAALRELNDPPAVLWSRGDWNVLQPPVVAVVGTRRSTGYGQRVTREIVSALARRGACIVSGMALGIDGVAHRAALDAGGRTVAVLGTGADVVYPRAHAALHREISERGLVLSELPPGARSDGGSFPRRNRIIAGLAQLTIVVEAPRDSGALLTSNRALELGRDVSAVPGLIDSPQSEGSNNLLREGAHVITSVSDALHLVGLSPIARITPDLRTGPERAIWHALHERGLMLDELCARSALPVVECLTAVTTMEMRGVIECVITGEIRRR